VAFAEGASKIVVLPGSEVSDIELKLLAVPAHAVRGVVLNPDGTPAPKVAIALAASFRFASVESKTDGTFEIAGVAEGEWRVSAEAQRGAVKVRATEWISVARHDIENVKLRLAPPLTVRGKVVMEAPKGSPLPRPSPLILSLRGGPNGEGDLGLGAGAALLNSDANGNLIAQDVYPGVYRMSPMIQPPPPPYYLDAVLAGDTDLTIHQLDELFEAPQVFGRVVAGEFAQEDRVGLAPDKTLDDRAEHRVVAGQLDHRAVDQLDRRAGSLFAELLGKNGH
jgi:hypothetical protein